MSPIPQRQEVVDWFAQNVTGSVDSLFIPKHQASAFMGIVVGNSNPSVAVLDFSIVLENLKKEGLSGDEAKVYALSKAMERKPYGPMLCYKYPNLHPNI